MKRIARYVLPFIGTDSQTYQIVIPAYDHGRLVRFGYTVKEYGTNGNYIGDVSFLANKRGKRVWFPMFNDNFVMFTNKPFYYYGRKRKLMKVNLVNFEPKTQLSIKLAVKNIALKFYFIYEYE